MISVLCPTRNRDENVRQLLNSIEETRRGVPVEVVFRTDEDAPLRRKLPDWATEIRGPRGILSDMWNEAYRHCTFDIVMQCGDDIMFRTPGWPARVLQEFEQVPDKIALVYGDDGFQHERLATHGFLHRRWVEAVGHVTPPYFSSDWGDQWINDVAGMIGRLRYMPDVLTEHLHPAAGKGIWDTTHEERAARGAADNVAAIWANTLHERQRDAEILRGLMQ